MAKKWEIGGYLDVERNHGTLYHEDAIALNCGRGCLRYVIEARRIKEIWIPDFMCGVVRSTCEDMGVHVNIYSIGINFKPIWNFEISDEQWLYLMDYYGQLTDSDVAYAREIAQNRIIVDETQGFFSIPRLSLDTIYTCRKYFGVPDGGFLYTNAQYDCKIETDVSWDRMSYILGRFELGSEPFFAEAKHNNVIVDNGKPMAMSSLTKNILRGIDYKEVASRRETNFRLLSSVLSDKNPLDIFCPKGPFAYPFLVSNGPSVRRRLATKGVFVPTLWPEVAENTAMDSLARRYARDILPLPIDQRYGVDEMKYIIRCLDEEGVI